MDNPSVLENRNPAPISTPVRDLPSPPSCRTLSCSLKATTSPAFVIDFCDASTPIRSMFDLTLIAAIASPSLTFIRVEIADAFTCKSVCSDSKTTVPDTQRESLCFNVVLSIHPGGHGGIPGNGQIAFAKSGRRPHIQTSVRRIPPDKTDMPRLDQSRIFPCRGPIPQRRFLRQTMKAGFQPASRRLRVHRIPNGHCSSCHQISNPAHCLQLNCGFPWVQTLQSKFGVADIGSCDEVATVPSTLRNTSPKLRVPLEIASSLANNAAAMADFPLNPSRIVRVGTLDPPGN